MGNGSRIHITSKHEIVKEGDFRFISKFGFILICFKSLEMGLLVGVIPFNSCALIDKGVLSCLTL
jgi:hypothetical protein